MGHAACRFRTWERAISRGVCCTPTIAAIQVIRSDSELHCPEWGRRILLTNSMQWQRWLACMAITLTDLHVPSVITTTRAAAVQVLVQSNWTQQHFKAKTTSPARSCASSGPPSAAVQCEQWLRQNKHQTLNDVCETSHPAIVANSQLASVLFIELVCAASSGANRWQGVSRHVCLVVAAWSVAAGQPSAVP